MLNIGIIRHYISAHHIANSILSVSFLFLRTVQPFCSTIFPKDSRELPLCKISWNETNVMLFLICVLVVKNRKSPPFQEYIGTVFTFTKAANVYLYMQADPRLMLLYSVACLVVIVVLPEPPYLGPHNLTYFEGNTLEEELRSNPYTTWIVEFFANWSSDCQAITGTFSELSWEYDHARLKFGKLDAGRYPEIAKKFGVDTSALCRQLPTVIHFQNGKEVSRKPVRDSNGKVVQYNFTKENIIRDFDLNKLYVATKSKAQKKAEKKVENKLQEEKKTN